MTFSRAYPWFLLSCFLAMLVWSGWHPMDGFTWFLEICPALIGLAAIAVYWKRFRLTELALGLACLHAIILMIGGHYTYAEVPLFNWLRDTFELSRNHYDRVGHLAQGFIPAILAREILWRKSPLRSSPGWLYFLVVCFCLAFSAFYELIEWQVAVYSKEAADAFLGTQGDNWDTQWDMACALIGALTAPLLLGRIHDRQLAAKERQ
jgi:putative membrane protein